MLAPMIGGGLSGGLTAAGGSAGPSSAWGGTLGGAMFDSSGWNVAFSGSKIDSTRAQTPLAGLDAAAANVGQYIPYIAVAMVGLIVWKATRKKA